MGKHMQIIDIRNEKSFLFFVDQPLPNADFFLPLLHRWTVKF